MPESGAYGERLGSRFNLENVPTVISRTFKKANLAVTRLRSDNPPTDLTFERRSFSCNSCPRMRPSDEHFLPGFQEENGIGPVRMARAYSARCT